MQKWIYSYSASIDEDGMKAAHNTEARWIIYDEHGRAPQNELLIHVVVEIETANTAPTIDFARALLKSVQLDEHETNVLY